ncbi:MAG: hypothetical protein HKN70_14635 [Gammaproteobacteria bacterium]|nr:hypothetical protein [Gammaproteobacteria bacterium]
MTRETQHAHLRFVRDVVAIGLSFVLIAITVNAEPNTNTDLNASAAVSEPEQKLSFSIGAGKDPQSSIAKRPYFDDPVQKRARSEPQQAQNSDFEIFDAIAALYYDDDGDGHYYGLEVSFDADTYYAVANVFARLYLSFEGGPWEHYYTTDVFAIFSDSSDDIYSVDTEFFVGYPTGYYDVLIELYDADYGDYLAELGPANAPDLRDLPLEDQQKDSLFPEPLALSVSHGGGGAASLVTLVMLGLAGLCRQRFVPIRLVRNVG